jgi:hypothetical protein
LDFLASNSLFSVVLNERQLGDEQFAAHSRAEVAAQVDSARRDDELYSSRESRLVSAIHLDELPLAGIEIDTG